MGVQLQTVRGRRLIASLAISASVHALGLLYLATRALVLGAPASPPPAQLQLTDLDEVEIEIDSVGVELVSLGETVPGASPSAPDVTLPDSVPPEVAGKTPGEIGGEIGDETAAPPATNALAMRSATRATDTGDRPVSDRDQAGDSSGTALTPQQAARVIVRDPGPPPPPPPRHPLDFPDVKLPRGLKKGKSGPRSELRPDGGGTYRTDDLTFKAKIGRDGKVQIEDKGDFSIGINLPSATEVGRAIEDWADQSYDTKRSKRTLPPLISGGINFDDWIARKAGQDPYYSRKKDFYDRTRDERSKIAATERTRALDESLDHLPGQLVEIWNYEGWTRVERRKMLFQLWDECAETGASSVVEAGNQARKKIIAFIRLRLPKTSEHAFTAAELRDLNRKRQSKREFRPY